MILKYTFFLIIICAYLWFTSKTQIRINKNLVLTKNQKIINSILIWIIPFIWMNLIKELLNDQMEPMTRDKRKKLLKKQRGGFTESGMDEHL